MNLDPADLDEFDAIDITILEEGASKTSKQPITRTLGAVCRS